MNIDEKYLINNMSKFTRQNREHECEIPKGDCWKITVMHYATKRVFTYYEEDNYCSLADQLSDSNEGIGLEEIK